MLYCLQKTENIERLDYLYEEQEQFFADQMIGFGNDNIQRGVHQRNRFDLPNNGHGRSIYHFQPFVGGAAGGPLLQPISR